MRIGIGRQRGARNYEAGTMPNQMLRVLLSYVDYVNRTVWPKSL